MNYPLGLLILLAIAGLILIGCLAVASVSKSIWEGVIL